MHKMLHLLKASLEIGWMGVLAASASRRGCDLGQHCQQMVLQRSEHAERQLDAQSKGSKGDRFNQRP